ncbi:cytochrome bd-I oxidase subunit CydX [Fluviibacter phosphoraccumulans]|jgi:cyd operon protein YbgT|nr:cytochrome bd-I oxidase subunit CydX [Fluviibacter phosphoraccumulans]
MWYFTWVLGVGFAIFLAILNALWMENAEARKMALLKPEPSPENNKHRE